MNMPVIKSEISLGHLITVGTIIVSIAIAWGNLDGRVKATESSTAAQAVQIKELTDESEADRLTLNGIRIDVGYLRDWVEEVKRQDRSALSQ